MIRSFVAIDPSDAVRTRLVEFGGDLAGLGADVRWLRAEGLHCTVKFLGDVEERRLEDVQLALRGVLAGALPFDASALGVGVFPSWRSPRVVWVGLEDEGGGCVGLAARIGAALVPLGFAPERRPFSPHITLGRVRGHRGWSHLAERLRLHERENFGATTVASIVVYRSDLRPTGSVYTPLWSIPLGEGC